MKKQRTDFQFDKETGITTCTIETNNKIYKGTAKCCDVDKDMMSPKTGSEIAYHRAMIQLLKDVKTSIALELKGLQRYYHIVNQSRHFNKENYMARMLYRQLQRYAHELSVLDNLIAEQQQQLTEWIKQKDEFYRKIRANRKKVRKDNND